MYIVYISSSQYSQGQSRIYYIHVEIFASESGIGRDWKGYEDCRKRDNKAI